MDPGFLDHDATLETIADVEHGRWAHWQHYLHQQCTPQPDGSLVIPADLVQRWERLASTDYADLTEEERASDREHAHAYLTALRHLRNEIEA